VTEVFIDLLKLTILCVALEMSFGTNYKQFAEHLDELFKEYMNQPVKEIEVKGKKKKFFLCKL